MLTTTLALIWRGNGCSDPPPCGYEDTLLAPDAETPWGTRVEDDMNQLLGPYEGTWRWEESNWAVAIESGGTEFPARATLTVDASTYRITEPTGPFDHGVVCAPTAISADGVLTITDLQEQVIVAVDVVATRDIDNPQYLSYTIIQPVSAFSAGVQPLMQYDVEGLKSYVYWGVDGESIRGEFVYGAQREITSESGEGVFALVATFTQN
ncbi:MAG: hypothetical protein HC927_05060 [Deltaproteobacteria bacterium]|nr:hypothetical protein [Deltaproteobacteria bacterium]